MKQKKVLYLVLLLPLMHNTSTNASSPSIDERPIPPTIEHPSLSRQPSYQKVASHSQMSQMYLYEVDYIDSDDEMYEKEEKKTNHEIKNSSLHHYYCHCIACPMESTVEEEISETPSPEKNMPKRHSSSQLHIASFQNQCHVLAQTCAMEARLKQFRQAPIASTKNIGRPRTSTI